MTFWDWLKDHGASVGAILTPILFGSFLIWQIDGFRSGVDKRIDGLGSDLGRRIDGLDKRIDGLDKRIDGVDKRIDGLDKRIDGVRSDLVEEIKELRAEFRSDRAEATRHRNIISQRLDNLFARPMTASNAAMAGGYDRALRLLAGQSVRTPVEVFITAGSRAERRDARSRWVRAALPNGVLTLYPEDERGRELLAAHGWRLGDITDSDSGFVARERAGPVEGGSAPAVR